MSQIMSFQVTDQLYNAIKKCSVDANCSMSEFIRLSLSNSTNTLYANKAIERRLKILSDVTKMSQAEVAKKHGISKQRVGQIVHGRYKKE